MAVPVDQQGYSSMLGTGARSTAQEMVPAQGYRAGLLGTPDMVTVMWKADPWEYRYLRAFLRTGVREGQEAFLIDLVTGDGTLRQCVARFSPGTWALASVQGCLHTVQASLEVERQLP